MRILTPILYMSALALLGSAGMSFYKALPANGAIKGGGPDINALQTKAATKAAELLRRGQETNAPGTSWNYKNKAWWQAFVEANFTGKLPPEPVDGPGAAGNEPPPPPKPAEKPLEEILSVVAILYEQRGEGGDVIPEAGTDPAGTNNPAPETAPGGEGEKPGEEGDGSDPARDPARDPLSRPEVANHTQVMIRYTPESGVMPDPVTASAQPATGNFGGGRPGRGITSSAVPGGVAEVTDTLSLGESLRAPFEHIRLVRVAEDAKSVFFVRTVEAPDGQGTVEQEPEEVFRGELGMNAISQDALRALVEAQRRRGVDVESVRDRPATPLANTGGSWSSVPQTRQVSPGQWNISQGDSNTLTQDPNRLLSQVGLSPYKGKSVRGVQVDNVSPEVSARFGVNSGDVIISVNGTPVSSRSNAINVGRKEYDRGARDFRVEVLTSTGRTETRTYRVPPK